MDRRSFEAAMNRPASSFAALLLLLPVWPGQTAAGRSERRLTDAPVLWCPLVHPTPSTSPNARSVRSGAAAKTRAVPHSTTQHDGCQ